MQGLPPQEEHRVGPPATGGASCRAPHHGRSIVQGLSPREEHRTGAPAKRGTLCRTSNHRRSILQGLLPREELSCTPRKKLSWRPGLAELSCPASRFPLWWSSARTPPRRSLKTVTRRPPRCWRRPPRPSTPPNRRRPPRRRRPPSRRRPPRRRRLPRCWKSPQGPR